MTGRHASAPATARPVRRRRLGLEDGAGTVATIGVAGFTVGLAALMLPIATVSIARHSAGASADAAALAAADVLIGVAVGDGRAGEYTWRGPCGAAEAIASAGGAQLTACVIDELVATVRAEVATTFGAVSATSTAGPPG